LLVEEAAVFYCSALAKPTPIRVDLKIQRRNYDSAAIISSSCLCNPHPQDISPARGVVAIRRALNFGHVMNIFETIREQVDIKEVALSFTQLKRAGKTMKGCCPIHKESTPSFFIYPDGRAHCFGCQFHGDVIDLWAALRGLQAGIEAALDLAHEYGIKLPDHDPKAQKKAEERRQKEASLEQQARAFHQALLQHPQIVEWWQQRGFNDELQKQLLLGSNHDGSSAIIPYWHRGRIHGPIRRQMAGEPKYMLTKAEDFPGGNKPLFIPGSTAGDVHLIEGFIDALSLEALGLNSIAIGGTGINEHQKVELLKLKGTIYIYPDADEAGAKSSRAWLGELYPKARLCKADYGNGRKDINDLFRDEGEKAKTYLEELKPSSVDALDLALSEAPKGSSNRQMWAYAREHVLPLMACHKNEGERNAALADAAKALGLKASDLQRAVKSETPAEDKETKEPAKLVLHEPELWPDPVDGAQLLDEFVRMIQRFVSAAEGVPETVALWSLFTHTHDAFQISPILGITSPEKRCGKTTLLLLVNTLVPRPLQVANITSSALFRAVEKYRPTLMIDEADTFLAGNEELRGIINSGHQRAGAYVIRTVGDEHEPHTFCTWAAKAIALIGTMPDTLEDRSFNIRMQRRRPGEGMEKLRLDRQDEFEPLRQRAARWGADNFDSLRVADPEIPNGIGNDRASDNWRVLLVIADAVGGDWPTRAREVALSFANTEPETQSIKVLLLHDLKAIFSEKDAERLESEEIVRALVDIEGRPWAEGKNGKPLSKTGLARMLKPFKIHPCPKWKEDGRTCRGYLRNDFTEVFCRYLDIKTPPSPPATQSTTYSQNETPPKDTPVAFANPDNSNGMNAVARVAFANPEEGQTEEEIEERKAILAEYAGEPNVPPGFEWTSIEGVRVLIRQSDQTTLPPDLNLLAFNAACQRIAQSHNISLQEAASIALQEHNALNAM
jgi:putative DNA primase/helicase